jgi:rRNA maturation RNase YbeY
MSELAIRNRQRCRRVQVPQLRRILQTLLVDLLRLRDFDVCVHLIGSSRISELNAKFLQHSGSTDVITFDYAESPSDGRITGEIFISVDDAVKHARQLHTSWQSEIVRYVIHGVLHLQGFDDVKPAQRRVMKREENRLLRRIGRRFPLHELGSRPKSEI